MEREIEKIVEWMRDIAKNAHAKGFVFGLSGGIDSAVIAGLAKRAFPEGALGIIMPIHSNEEDEADAHLVAEALDLEIVKVDLSSTFDALVENSFESQNRMAISNVKPRLRMTTLYYYGQDRGYLVCGSSNASEYHVGYFTKFGDSGSDLLPLVSFVKSEVVELAKALGIPEKVITKQPTAGLYAGQTDEMEMGFTYEELDKTIREGYKGENFEKIDRMNKNSQHKREYPPRYERG